MSEKKRINHVGQLKQLLFIPLMGMLLIFSSTNVMARALDSVINLQTSKDTTVYRVVQETAKFPGGDQALLEFITANLNYPKIAKEKGIEGRVYVELVINEDGAVTNAEAKLSPDPLLTKEAIRLVNSLPKWIPGKMDGKAVKVRFTMPVTFRLPVKETPPAK